MSGKCEHFRGLWWFNPQCYIGAFATGLHSGQQDSADAVADVVNWDQTLVVREKAKMCGHMHHRWFFFFTLINFVLRVDHHQIWHCLKRRSISQTLQRRRSTRQ